MTPYGQKVEAERQRALEHRHPVLGSIHLYHLDEAARHPVQEFPGDGHYAAVQLVSYPGRWRYATREEVAQWETELRIRTEQSAMHAQNGHSVYVANPAAVIEHLTKEKC